MVYVLIPLVLVIVAAWVHLVRLGWMADRRSRERMAYAAETRRMAHVMAVHPGRLAGAPAAVLALLESCSACGREFLPGHLCRSHRLCGFCHPPAAVPEGPRTPTRAARPRRGGRGGRT